VITIQSAMLVALGFLAATLLALLVAPAFWARAVRLTRQRMRQSMPLSEAEIRADKDRIRAEYAIRVHQLESQINQARLSSARQLIDLNRRDATINELQAEIERNKAALEEAQNARRVLEQTVTDRLPRVEHRLSEARQLVFNRDREISELARTADKQSRALAEAAAINAQQLAEIERLTSTLATRAARSHDGRGDPRFDSEVALRSELEALRAKTRDQSQLISRMQSQMGRFASYTPTPAATLRALDSTAEALPSPNGAAAAAGDDGKAGTRAGASIGDIEALRAEFENEVRTLRAKTQDQAGEIARLKAALAVFEGESEEQKLSIRDSKIALKARLGGLEAQNEQQREVILRVRSELAAANERLARQAAHFTSELKRLGAGTLPVSGQPRRQISAPRLTLADRVAQARTAPAPAENGAAGEIAHGAENGPRPNGAIVEGDKSKTKPSDGAIVDLETAKLKPAEAVAQPPSKPEATEKEEAEATAGVENASAPTTVERKPRLLERIASLGKS
jgi:hypothetical protein